MRGRAVAIAVLAAALGAGGVCTPVANAHPPSNLSKAAEQATVDEVKAFRRQVAEAAAARDRGRLAKLYSATFRHTTAAGRLDDHAARIATVITGGAVIESADADDLVIHIPGGWTAVVTGSSRLGPAVRVRWTAVYVRTETGWEIVAQHESRISGP